MTTGETNFTSTDKLYLLSTHEVWEDDDVNTILGINDDTAYSDTRQLDYYVGLNVTTSSCYGVAKRKNVSGSTWWLCSADYYHTYGFYCVRSQGDWGLVILIDLGFHQLLGLDKCKANS